MKRTMLATAVALAVSTVASAPAVAFHCPRDMIKIDETLATKHHWMRSTSVSGSQLARIKALRADGERLHQSGKHEEPVEALAEAMKILGIE
jgi:Spy/CpxP family protein refolding chaperone